MRMTRLHGLALAPRAVGGVARHLGENLSGRITLTPRVERFLRLAVLSGFLIAAVAFELRSSVVQSRLLSFVSSRLTYTVGSGASPRIVFPRNGPFDVRHGYARIPGFERRLTNQGYRVVEQARFSSALALATRAGLFPPYRERSLAGLRIAGADGGVVYDAGAGSPTFRGFESIPPIVVRSLLYMEDRDLGQGPGPSSNPSIDWGRLAKAALLYAGHRLGMPVRLEGGSTLAVQLEKYRHSEGGRTSSPLSKLAQVASASLRVYQDGPDAREARKRIVVDYLNTMPLAAAPGHGEVFGLGDGLRTWFRLDPASTCRTLASPEPTPAKARALKHVLALLYAVRAPSAYLAGDHAALEARLLPWIDRLERERVIDPPLARLMRNVHLRFAYPDEIAAARAGAWSASRESKGASLARSTLARLIGARDLYDLDRVDLEVVSTIDTGVQDQAEALFERLAEPSFVASHGLRGERLLSSGDPARVIYSLVVYERTPEGNALRVHADNLDEPFDVNQGTKMELGSTAKLRTLAHYLEVMAELHAEMAGLDVPTLEARAATARDPLTRWAASTLSREPGMELTAFLGRSLERTYSARSSEAFFTGGGVHVFHNFDPADNHRVLPVREAVARSTNLVFIRLMRDLVRFHEARLPYDPGTVLADARDPERARLLAEAADQEARQVLARAWRDQRGLTEAELVDRLLGRSPSPRRLAELFYGWNPGASADSLERWLSARARVSSEEALRLHAAYGGPLTLADRGFLLRRHPLEVWCAGELARRPNLSWEELLGRSEGARRASSAWLLHTRNRAAQERRLRVRIEQDAFARMTPYWRRLGYPFERLVPSLATAIGSSSDRPEALADLMGIIVNDGVRRPTLLIERLCFGPGTPYHTELVPSASREERVLAQPVARLLREVLADVVEEGTARRVRDAFSTPEGEPVRVGGKTGSGDNRYVTVLKGGARVSRPVSRTAAFVFYIGDRYFGVVTASVSGPAAGQYRFTSALPLEVLKLLAPAFEPHLGPSPSSSFARAEGVAGVRGRTDS